MWILENAAFFVMILDRTIWILKLLGIGWCNGRSDWLIRFSHWIDRLIDWLKCRLIDRVLVCSIDWPTTRWLIDWLGRFNLDTGSIIRLINQLLFVVSFRSTKIRPPSAPTLAIKLPPTRTFTCLAPNLATSRAAADSATTAPRWAALSPSTTTPPNTIFPRWINSVSVCRISRLLRTVRAARTAVGAAAAAVGRIRCDWWVAAVGPCSRRPITIIARRRSWWRWRTRTTAGCSPGHKVFRRSHSNRIIWRIRCGSRQMPGHKRFFKLCGHFLTNTG